MFDDPGEFGGLHSRIRQIFEQAKAQAGSPSSKPSVYGFTMGFSKEGKPVFDEFGNSSAYGVDGFTEPITDVIEKHDKVCVIAELPGIEKEQIDLRVTVEAVSIMVDTPYRRYKKNVKLSTKVKPGSTLARFNNGVLEINLSRLDGGATGTRIDIE